MYSPHSLVSSVADSLKPNMALLFILTNCMCIYYISSHSSFKKLRLVYVSLQNRLQ